MVESTRIPLAEAISDLNLSQRAQSLAEVSKMADAGSNGLSFLTLGHDNNATRSLIGEGVRFLQRVRGDIDCYRLGVPVKDVPLPYHPGEIVSRLLEQVVETVPGRRLPQAEELVIANEQNARYIAETAQDLIRSLLPLVAARVGLLQKELPMVVNRYDKLKHLYTKASEVAHTEHTTGIIGSSTLRVYTS